MSMTFVMNAKVDIASGHSDDGRKRAGGGCRMRWEMGIYRRDEVVANTDVERRNASSQPKNRYPLVHI
jgi:hypothetical protein